MEEDRDGHCTTGATSALNGQENANKVEVRFTAYGNPCAKERPRVANNHAYTPRKTKEQEEKIAWMYKSVYRSFKFPKGVPLKIEVDMYLAIPASETKKAKDAMRSGKIRPVKRIIDTDNGVKLVMDALNGVAYEDDSQIVEIVGRKFYSDVPRTEVCITRL